jgi:uncharacterized protein (TIGR01777 family)
MKIVVAGGTGFLGSALVDGWRRDANEVVVLTRRPRSRDQIGWSPGTSDTSWVKALDGADAVVNLAGETIAGGRWSVARKAAIRDSRIRATRALASALTLAARPPGVFVSASGVGVYGPRADEPVTEETPPGFDFLASVCREWEAEALEASTVARVVLLRTGLVLSMNGGALEQISLPFRFFAGGVIGSGRQHMSWIHLEDWVAMVRWALATTTLSGPLNLTAPNPVTNAEFTRELAHALGRPAFVPAPAFALRLALGEMADALLLTGQRVLPAKALSLGFRFRYEKLGEALRAVYGAP